MTLCVIYYAIVVPLQMAFDLGSNEFIEMFFNLLFVFDIGINFVTAFKKGGVLIKDRREIAYEYMRTWFLIDLVSALPVDLLIKDLRQKQQSSSTGNNVNKLLRMLRIFKLLRVVKIRRVFKRLEQYTKLNPSLVRLSKTLVVLVFAWHWIACMYVNQKQ